MKKKRTPPKTLTPQSQASEPMVQYGYSTTFNPGFLGLKIPSDGWKSIVPKDTLSAISLIKSGITKHSLDVLQQATGISPLEMSGYMHVSERTLRNYDDNTLLNPEMSERALEIAQLFEKGCDVFGSLAAFQKYIESDVLAFGGQKPKFFLDTSLGIQFLLNELGRIEHGVFA